jgi:hypothetical protein
MPQVPAPWQYRALFKSDFSFCDSSISDGLQTLNRSILVWIIVLQFGRSDEIYGQSGNVYTYMQMCYKYIIVHRRRALVHRAPSRIHLSNTILVLFDRVGGASLFSCLLYQVGVIAVAGDGTHSMSVDYLALRARFPCALAKISRWEMPYWQALVALLIVICTPKSPRPLWRHRENRDPLLRTTQ